MSGKYSDLMREEDVKRKRILLSAACIVVILTFCIGIGLSRLAVGNVDVTEGVEKIEEQSGEDVEAVEKRLLDAFAGEEPDLSGWKPSDEKKSNPAAEAASWKRWAGTEGMGAASFFLLFLLPVLALYYIVPKGGRNAMFAVLSAWIFAWGRPVPACIFALWAVLHYFGGFYIHVRRQRKRSAGWLPAVMAGVDLCVLTLLRVFAKEFLPVGTTWFLLGQLSYVIDVYKGRAEVQTSGGAYAAYSFFFPVMTAGPVLQYARMEKQLSGREETLGNFARGIQNMLTGLAKVLWIGDSMARIFVETGMAELAASGMGEQTAGRGAGAAAGLAVQASGTAAEAWIGTLALGAALYFTMSGLSDIARGLGRLFGFELPENFTYPYLAESMREFWRRCNRTLCGWFGTYIYAPLKAGLGTLPGRLAALFLTWILLGCCHGIALRFLLWGVFMGLLLVLETAFTGKLKAKLPKAVRILWQYLLVTAGWVILFAGTPDAMVQWFGRLAGIGTKGIVDTKALYLLKENWLVWLSACVGCTPFVKRIYMALVQRERQAHPWINALVFSILFLLCVTWILGGGGQYLPALAL